MKYKLTSTVDRILANHSGWSGIKCQTCGRETNNAQYFYSMSFYKKPLGKWCQSLEQYKKEKNFQILLQKQFY